MHCCLIARHPDPVAGQVVQGQRCCECSTENVNQRACLTPKELSRVSQRTLASFCTSSAEYRAIIDDCLTGMVEVQHLAQAAAERNQATQKRRDAEARAFVAQPSLFLCIEHLCTKFLFPLATGHCPVCSKRLLPSDSKKLGKVPADMQVGPGACIVLCVLCMS